MSASLSLTDIACRRGGRMLFEAFDLSLAAGEAAVVTGPNGSGKSSLLRLMAGLLTPAQGQIVCEGRIALADEMLALDSERSLSAALGFWARIDGCDSADAALRSLALDHLAEVPVRMLSTGQRKRAMLARVIAAGADIWLLDEPANGLDGASLQRLESMIADHRASGGVAVIASHQPLQIGKTRQVSLGAAG